MTRMRSAVKAVADSAGFYLALRRLVSLAQREMWNQGPKKRRLKALASTARQVKLVPAWRSDRWRSVVFRENCRRARVRVLTEDMFLYCPDFHLLAVGLKMGELIRLGNLAPDYGIVLARGVTGIRADVEAELSADKLSPEEREFLESLLDVCGSVLLYQNRCCSVLERGLANHPDGERRKEVAAMLRRVPEQPARSFREALQSYLLINSLLWMSGHALVGLGRLDQILLPYFTNDVDRCLLGEGEAVMEIKAFVSALHKGYLPKSNVLPGDTGQAIVLGGRRGDGSDGNNRLTELFLDALRELRLPDPKAVFRVHADTPKECLTKAVLCAAAGVPILLTNDEVTVDALTQFGYSPDDACDYGVSACWEPLIHGKSLDQNNLGTLNFLAPLNDVLRETQDASAKDLSFRELIDRYLSALRRYSLSLAASVANMRFECAPLLSLMTTNCIGRRKDIAQGGADYNNFGLLSVGLGNAINALLNIRRLVWDERRLTLAGLRLALESDFHDDDVLLADLRSRGPKFGADDPQCASLANLVIQTVSDALSQCKNHMGGRLKFGLSSPAFISEGSGFPATADGRRSGQPFGTHISPLPYSPPVPLTALANFAASLDSRQAFNGAVTDILVDQGTLHSHCGAFSAFVRAFFAQGGMQLQVSALDSKALLEASRDPAAHPNLLVRVWGFSAYFKDLPAEYQEYLIEKAQRFADAGV